MNRLNTRIITKHDDLTTLNNSAFIPYEGEIVLAKVTSYDVNGVAVPTYLIKVGDGANTFSNLKWAGAQALDVYNWAKQQKLQITTAGDETGNVVSGIEATDTGITITKTTVATSQAVAELEEALEALTKTHGEDIDRIDAAIEALQTGLAGKAATEHTHEINDVTGLSDAIADAKAAGTGAQQTIDTFIQTTAPQTYVTKESFNATLEGKADSGHTHATTDLSDWTTVKAAIDADIADAKSAGTSAQSALTQYSEDHAGDYTNTQIDSQINSAVAAEAELRESADNGLSTRIGNLENQITGLTGAMHFKGIKDQVPEEDALKDYAQGDVIAVGDIEYVFNGTSFVELGDVTAQGQRISALETKVGSDVDGQTPATGLFKEIDDIAAGLQAETEAREAADNAINAKFGAEYDENSTVASAIKDAKDTASGAQDTIDTFINTTAPQTYVTKEVYNAHTKAFDDYVSANDEAVNNKVDTETFNATLEGKADVDHTHAIDDVTDLSDALEGKADSGHTHATTDLSDWTTVKAAIDKDIEDAEKAGTDAQDTIDTFISTTAPDTYLAKEDFSTFSAKAVTVENNTDFGGDVLMAGANVIIFDCGTATSNIVNLT